MKTAISKTKRSHMFSRGVLLTFVVLSAVIVLAPAPTAHAAVFIVNSTGDAADANLADGVCQTATPGQCTLRAAVQQANAVAGTDTIAFNVPGPGPYVIQPAPAALPFFVSDPVIMDGYTQPGSSPNTNGPALGSNAVLKIEIEGDSLFLAGGNSTVRGLVIRGFASSGIVMFGVGGNTIEGNFIGTDVSGTVALGGQTGVAISNVPNNTIGGTTPGARNLISGNSVDDITIGGSTATGNVVLGNFIGTDVTGTTSLGGTFSNHGITVQAPNNVIGGTTPAARNIISGSGINVRLAGGFGTGNTLQGNFIGTDVTGTVALGNVEGVVLDTGASNNTIGGTTGGARNVISGNVFIGVELIGNSVTGNKVQGNFIGPDVTGTVALGNERGVSVEGPGNTIGGTTAGAGNVISGNLIGIVIFFSGNVVQGNFIGTDVSGTTALGNEVGVDISDPGSNTLVGGTAPGAGNVISGNVDFGVRVFGTGGNLVQGNFIGTDTSGTIVLGNRGGVMLRGSNNTVGGTAGGAPNVIVFNGAFGGVFADGGASNAILSNRILSNRSLGIDLGGDFAVTANDVGDGDAGPNGLQNFPVLTSVTSGSGTTTIAGTLNSAANQTFRLELFANSTCDPSGFGEGETLIGATNVTTDGGGNVGFALTFGSAVHPGQFVTATATDAGNNTSEFSQCRQVLQPANRPPVANAGGPYTVNEGGTVVLSGSGTDPDGDPLTFAWDLDQNGSFETIAQNPPFSAADGPSTRTVTLRVCDPLGLCDTALATVAVNNVAPAVDAGPNQSILSGQTVIVSATFSDPGVDDHPWLYSIDWNDGSSDTSSTNVQSAPIAGTHLYSEPREYTVEVCVTDKDGGKGCDTLVASVHPLPVTIDIKPGSDPNSINCRNPNEVITVAILSTATFDATTVDHTTVLFEGAGETHLDKKTGQPLRHEEDVNGDGRVDLVIHVRLAGTNLTCASTTGTLEGKTFAGQSLEGTDAVRMLD